jgi:uncharacterized protein YndB with AHSA1/START domain
MPAKNAELQLDVAADIAAPVDRVFASFFDAEALARWRRTSRSIAVPRLLGPYVLEWPPTVERDEVLGRLGGVFRATVMQVAPNDHLFLADAFWLPPDGGPLGPLAAHIDLTFASTPEGDPATHVRVLITGFDDGVRWKRYLGLSRSEWRENLDALKNMLENRR